MEGTKKCYCDREQKNNQWAHNWSYGQIWCMEGHQESPEIDKWWNSHGNEHSSNMSGSAPCYA